MSIAERDQVIRECDEAGVPGAHDFGRFVNDTTHFSPSAFDERAAMPTLLRLLPTLRDEAVVSAVAGHLRRPWARPIAFPALLASFELWAERSPGAGWQLGDALATSADKTRLVNLLSVAQDPRYGKSRQMVVYSLWRFKTDEQVAPALIRLVNDPDVALHAASALRRVIGSEAALPVLRSARDRHSDSTAKAALGREIAKAERAIA